MSVLKKSQFSVDIPIQYPGKGLRAVYQTMTRAFILFPEDDWLAITNGSLEQLDPDILEILCEQGFLVKSETDEAAVFESWRQQYVHDFSSIKSKVAVTRKCNNMCRYCIMETEAKDMSLETAQAMDRFYIELIKEKKPQSVEDVYSGGEVLLNPQVVLDSAARRYYFCMGRDIPYNFSIITNGTLITPAIISAMKEVGLTAIRVSLAGPAEIHDHLRPSRGNGKTFDRIMQNLKSVSGLIPIRIECNYDSTATDYLRLPEMMDDIKSRGIVFDNITFTPILPRRGESVYCGGTGDPETLLFLMREADKRGYPQFREAPSNACLSDYRSRLSFDTDGSIVACSALQSGEITSGNVFKGIDFVAQSQVLARKFRKKCLEECDLLPMCMGGCRLQVLAKTGDFNGVDCQYEAIDLILKEFMKRRAEAAVGGWKESEESKEAA
jgi:uncharacterized protein